MPDIAHELTIDATPDEIFRAVTTREGFATWWTPDAEDADTVDRTATFGFADTDDRITMRVDALEEPELVHWECTGGPDEWVGTKVAFRIEGRDGGSVLRFWHGDWEYEDGLLPAASFRWAMHLDALRRHLEGGGAPGS